jgi:16S rRNA (guanine527-N7)-methyltransferase
MTEDDLSERMSVSRETLDRLGVFVDLLRKWNGRINLVASSTLGDAWKRHVLDSAQLLEIAPEDASTWVDLGTGGGFPGLVVAIAAADVRPDLHVTLVEADQRKASFLREAARTVGVDVTILAQRVGGLSIGPFDVISARAFGSLVDLLRLSIPIVRPGGVMLFPKGRSVEEEIAAARLHFGFQAEQTISHSGGGGVIVKIWDAAHE